MTKKRKFRKRTSKRAKRNDRRIAIWSVSITVFIALMFSVFVYRYYKIERAIPKIVSSFKLPAQDEKDRRFQAYIFDLHDDKLLGIDVSHYQGEIDWNHLGLHQEPGLSFVFMRATMGIDGKDRKFHENWRHLENHIPHKGAYHYFRPNEDAALQAENFIESVQLSAGDLPPVLDIEEMPKIQTMESLKTELKIWLSRVEAHYGVKPILYAPNAYFNSYLRTEFSEYPLWLANYNHWITAPPDGCHFWQFSEKGVIQGIGHHTDLNVFNGSWPELETLLVK